MKRILISCAVAVALVLPVAAIGTASTSARGGQGEWPQSVTR